MRLPEVLSLRLRLPERALMADAHRCSQAAIAFGAQLSRVGHCARRRLHFCDDAAHRLTPARAVGLDDHGRRFNGRQLFLQTLDTREMVGNDGQPCQR